MNKIFIISLLVGLFFCLGCSWVAPENAQFIVFKGDFESYNVDDELEVNWADEVFTLFDKDSVQYGKSLVVDSTGGFFLIADYPSESLDNYWEAAPLEFYIEHPKYETYYRKFNEEDIKQMVQVTFEEAGIKRIDDDDWGVYKLPPIVLVLKDSANALQE